MVLKASDMGLFLPVRPEVVEADFISMLRGERGGENFIS